MAKRIALFFILVGVVSFVAMAAVVVQPDLLDEDRRVALVAGAPVAAAVAVAVLTLLLLQAGERQIEALNRQVEEERANREFQVEALNRQIAEERANREFQENEAAKSHEESQRLLVESMKARRDDHAPAATVKLETSRLIALRQGGDEHVKFPDHILQVDYRDWRGRVHLRFVVTNHGPGPAVAYFPPPYHTAISAFTTVGEWRK
jgi:hypothetical protein